MTQDSSTVKETWGLCCPQCGEDDRIDIEAEMMVRLKPDGTDPYEAENHHHEWHDQSIAACGCGYVGTVRAFTIEEEKP